MKEGSKERKEGERRKEGRNTYKKETK